MVERNRAQRNQLRDEMDKAMDELHKSHRRREAQLQAEVRTAFERAQSALEREARATATLKAQQQQQQRRQQQAADHVAAAEGDTSAEGGTSATAQVQALEELGGPPAGAVGLPHLRSLSLRGLAGYRPTSHSESPRNSGTASPRRPASPTNSVNSLTSALSEVWEGRSVSMSGVWARRHLARAETMLRRGPNTADEASQSFLPTPPYDGGGG